MVRDAQPVVAFSWGFAIEGGEITLIELRALPLSEWDKHGSLLSGQYPTWRFLPA